MLLDSLNHKRAFFEADQILDGLITKFSVPYSEIDEVLFALELNEKIVVDSSILIDSRLSSLIVRITQGRFKEKYHIREPPEIIVPNIVTFEIKSMIDRKRPKEVQYVLGDHELLRLKALSDAGYITLSYVGEIPSYPPVIEKEKGLWKFVGSLRDEYILKVLKQVENSVLLTADRELAKSAYIRDHEVILLRPLKEEIRQRYKRILSNKRLSLKVSTEQLFIPKETASKIIDSILSKKQRK